MIETALGGYVLRLDIIRKLLGGQRFAYEVTLDLVTAAGAEKFKLK